MTDMKSVIEFFAFLENWEENVSKSLDVVLTIIHLQVHDLYLQLPVHISWVRPHLQ